MRDADSLDVQVSEEAEKKARKLFLGSLVLSVLIVVHIVYLAERGGGLLATISTFLPAVLLWSLAMTGYAFYMLYSIAQQRAARLSKAFTDFSTGVFTLAYLKSCLLQEHKRALEMGTFAAVLYVDMVNLERVNRDFGHAVGDIVLKAVAQVIEANVRRGDTVGRVGGDEFLVIMPETTAEEAQGVVQSIRRIIKAYRLDLGKRGVIDFLDCKTGLAIFPAEGASPEDLVAAAREKLDGSSSAK